MAFSALQSCSSVLISALIITHSSLGLQIYREALVNWRLWSTKMVSEGLSFLASASGETWYSIAGILSYFYLMCMLFDPGMHLQNSQHLDRHLGFKHSRHNSLACKPYLLNSGSTVWWLMASLSLTWWFCYPRQYRNSFSWSWFQVWGSLSLQFVIHSVLAGRIILNIRQVFDQGLQTELHTRYESLQFEAMSVWRAIHGGVSRLWKYISLHYYC